ncbi:MAG: ACP S-malonyltransferase [Oscillospiraceae bacterium]
MKLGFLYAGQGSQHPGMGQDLYETYPAFREVLDRAETDFDLKALCFQGPEQLLNQTRYTQPCMVAFAAGLTAVLKEMGIVPDLVAGLSLGEYSALAAAGGLDAQTAISLAAFRGRPWRKPRLAMTAPWWRFWAFPGAAFEAVRESQSLGTVVIANYNCPGQLVLGRQGCGAAGCRPGKGPGARRCVPLRVSGPFHTPLMAPAGTALEERFRKTSFREPKIPVLFNCLGREKGPEDSIPALLVRQVQSSVYMEDTIRRMEELGAEALVEIGPGNALTGFVNRTLPQMPVYPVETVADVTGLPQWLAQTEKEKHL